FSSPPPRSPSPQRECDLPAGFRLLNGLLAGFIGNGRGGQEVGGAGLDRQIRNSCGFELLRHAHEILRRSLAPAELGIESRQELLMRQRLCTVIAPIGDQWAKRIGELL